jgi:hypothetical protein
MTRPGGPCPAGHDPWPVGARGARCGRRTGPGNVMTPRTNAGGLAQLK